MDKVLSGVTVAVFFKNVPATGANATKQNECVTAGVTTIRAARTSENEPRDLLITNLQVISKVNSPFKTRHDLICRLLYISSG